MRRRLAGVSLTVAVLTGAAVLSGFTASASSSTKRVTVLATATAFHVVSKSGASFPSSPGDQVLGAARFTAHGKTVGHDAFACVVVDGTRSSCQATNSLQGGDLITAGVNDQAHKTNTLAIVGGTGAYRGATGEVTTTTLSRSQEREVFTIVR